MGRVTPIGDQYVLPHRKLPVREHPEADGGGLDGGDGIQRRGNIEETRPHGRYSRGLAVFVYGFAGSVDQRGRDLAGGQAGMRRQTSAAAPATTGAAMLVPLNCSNPLGRNE